MGEYALYQGDRVKIGTCEEMLYLRAEQAREVCAEAGNVDPVRDARQIRFRFPWPDEDGTAPGHYDDPFRRRRIDGVSAPEGVDHGSVQFRAEREGYVCSLPCPESGAELPDGVRIARNGFAGATFLCEQAIRGEEGLLCVILQCACGTKWNVPTLEGALPVLEALAEEDRRYRAGCQPPLPDDAMTPARAIFELVRRGYDPEYVASLGLAARAD